MPMYNPNLGLGQTAQNPYSAAAQAALQRLMDTSSQHNQWNLSHMNSAGTMFGENPFDASAATNAANDLANKANAWTSQHANDQQQQYRDQIQRQTTGWGDQIMSDPRITAALDALDPTRAHNDFYSQASDQTASSTAAQGDLLRQQMQQLGVSTNDPAYQAQLRDIATKQLQANNANQATANDVGRAAANQSAGIRLGQTAQAGSAYSQGANYLANTQLSSGHADAGYQQPMGYALPSGNDFTTPTSSTPSLYQPNFDFANQQQPATGAGSTAPSSWQSDPNANGYLNDAASAGQNYGADYGESWASDPNASGYMQDAAQAGQNYGASWASGVPAYTAPTTWGKMSPGRPNAPRPTGTGAQTTRNPYRSL